MSCGPIPINRLSTTDSLSAGDSFVVFKNSQGDPRRASVTNTTTYMQKNLDFTDVNANRKFKVIDRAYSSTFIQDVEVPTDGKHVQYIFTITGTVDGTIKFPVTSSIPDGMEVMIIVASGSLSPVTYDGNGATVLRIVETNPSYFFNSYRYQKETNTWFQITKS